MFFYLYLSLALEKVDLLVHIQKIQLELDRHKTNAEEYAKLCEELQTKEKETESSLKHLKMELEGKELECKKWITKVTQANELARDIRIALTACNNKVRIRWSRGSSFFDFKG